MSDQADKRSSQKLQESQTLLEQLDTSSSSEDVLARLSQIEQTLTRVSEKGAPALWATLHRRLGDALTGVETGDRPAQLQRALMHYDAALRLLDQNRTSTERELAQVGKLSTLEALAEWQMGEERRKTLTAALACLDADSQIHTREDAPDDWARVQNNKGSMLRKLAELLAKDAQGVMLQAAIDCHVAAAHVYTPDSTPSAWVANQNNWALALRGVAVLQAGEARRAALAAAVACLDAALHVHQGNISDAEYAMTQNNKGGMLLEIADLEAGEARRITLSAAISCFEAILRLGKDQIAADSWCAAQSNKGSALVEVARGSELGERRALLAQAIACYDAAISSRTPPAGPTAPAVTQLKKGAALCDLAELQGESEERQCTLSAAVACYDAALEVYTREDFPTEWAQAQNDKGLTLSDMVDLQAGEERRATLTAAVACYDAALEVYTREDFPTDWAQAQSNKGYVLSDMAELQVGEERLHTMQALCRIYDDALTICTKGTAATDWAMIMTNKGNALSAVAELQVGEERQRTVEAVLACYDCAFEVYRREDFPADWAMTQHNRGSALQDLARLQTGKEQWHTLEAALACYDAALTVRTREDFPTDWASTQNNKGATLRSMAVLQAGAKRQLTLQEAIRCHDAALAVRTRAAAPFQWAKTQSNKGGVLYDLGVLQTGEDRRCTLAKALACYDDALTVLSRQLTPTEHRDGARMAGMLLFNERDWCGAASYLSEALDTLDDLFHMNVTAQGRRNELIAGSDVAANLAYACARGGCGRALDAAEALERGRARVSGEALARQQAQLATAGRVAPAQLERFRRISDQLVALSLSAARPEAGGLGASGTRADEYALAKAARAEYDALLADLREVLPDFLLDDDPLATITKSLGPRERVAYLAHTSAGSVAILISGPHGARCEPLVRAWWDQRLTTAVLGRLLAQQQGGPLSEQTTKDGQSTGKAMTTRLGFAVKRSIVALGAAHGVLTKLAKECRQQGVHHLILVPCGLYGFLPVHAALIPGPTRLAPVEPLQDIVRVSYAPSGRIWAVCRARVIAAASATSDVEALVVGDPQPQFHARPLPGAAAEARHVRHLVASLAGGRLVPSGKALDGEAARYRSVLAVLRTHGPSMTHAHFACHGIIEWSEPERSGLLLANEARLMVRDVLDPEQRRFARLRLATLSACQTGLPGDQLPDEVVSLPSAWLQAGAAGVIASLWPVSDAATVGLMRKFYELHLLDNLEPGDALWLAQRWLRNLPSWRQDCLNAGAPLGATGPNAPTLVGAIARSRGERNPLDESPDADVKLLDAEHARHRFRWVQRQAFDTVLLHWAAFAHFGA